LSARESTTPQKNARGCQCSQQIHYTVLSPKAAYLGEMS
jgi:hypothetical protein